MLVALQHLLVFRGADVLTVPGAATHSRGETRRGNECTYHCGGRMHALQPTTNGCFIYTLILYIATYMLARRTSLGTLSV